MIYTFGCSFTKWYWPTWSDWLARMSNEPLTNIAWPGLSNETIYWELLNADIKKTDTVYIMLTGNDRTSVWYDDEWIATNDCRGFFPRRDGKLECSNTQWQGLYRTHPEFELSITHMMVSCFSVILQMQLFLNAIGCEYTMLFWQNPWHDTRPIKTPEWQVTWDNKGSLSKKDITRHDELVKNKYVLNLLHKIDWVKFRFNGEFNVSIPQSYDGLWEYTLFNIAYDEYWNKFDNHPNTLAHYDYLQEIILGSETSGIARDVAKNKAIDYKNFELPYDVTKDLSFLIPDDITENLI
jgi:hypothetical protein